MDGQHVVQPCQVLAQKRQAKIKTNKQACRRPSIVVATETIQHTLAAVICAAEALDEAVDLRLDPHLVLVADAVLAQEVELDVVGRLFQALHILHLLQLHRMGEMSHDYIMSRLQADDWLCQASNIIHLNYCAD